jgi:hypothetical protein
MPEWCELRNGALKHACNYREFRDLVEAVGYTIAVERPLPNGTGMQIHTKEGPKPVFHYTGRWYVQGRDVDDCTAKLMGDITELAPFPHEVSAKVGYAAECASGVLVYASALADQIPALSDLLRRVGLDPLSLQRERQRWVAVIDNADCYRLKSRMGIVLATPEELVGLTTVHLALSYLPALLGPGNVILLVKGDDLGRECLLPERVEQIAFEELDNEMEDEIVRALLVRADRVLRLKMTDEARDRINRAFQPRYRRKHE